MEVAESEGMVTDVKLLQYMKAEPPMELTVAGMVIEVNGVPQNTIKPIEVTEGGISTDDMEHVLKALSPICVIPSVIITDFTEEEYPPSAQGVLGGPSGHV